MIVSLSLFSRGLGAEIARHLSVSAGFVTKFARERGLWFENDYQPMVATHVRQIDQRAKRVDAREQLEDQILAAVDQGQHRRLRKRPPT